MAISQPSQYDCDQMEPGDLILERHRNFLYKFYRKHFQKDKTILKAKTDWINNTYKHYYQEDCTLLYSYELQSVQLLHNEVPCIISFSSKDPFGLKILIKEVKIGLTNMQFVFKNNIVVTMPIAPIEHAFQKNSDIIEQSKDKRKIYENLRFQRYKGDYFKNRVIEYNITEWIPAYCSLCGNAVKFIFKENNVEVINNCNCGNLNIDAKQMTYDELAVWYYTQTNNIVTNKYKEFWFGDK